MTNVVYILGDGANKSDNLPLRWALRSLAKFAANVGKVTVAGVIPDWLSDEVVKVPCDTTSGSKEWNILNGIVEVAKTLQESDAFLYSSDDHYFLPGKGGVAHDLDKWPMYYSGQIKTQAELTAIANKTGKLPGLYQFALARTRAMLELEKLPVRRACVHLNMWRTAKDVLAAGALVNKYAKDKRSGFVADVVVNAFYEKRMAEEGKTPEFTLFKQDFKVGNLSDLNKKLKLGCPQFSTDSKGERNPEIIRWMEQTFPEPCKWEKVNQETQPAQA